MPSSKAAKPKSMGRGLTPKKVPRGGSMELGSKLPAKKMAKGRKGHAKKGKVPSKGPPLPAMLGGGKKGKAPPFPGAAPPLE